MSCQIRGLTSFRKGLGKDVTPFLVYSNSIKASENVSGRVSGENLDSLREAIFTNPEGSQSGGVLFLSIPRGPNFANVKGSQSERVLFLPIRGVLFLSIRRGIVSSRVRKITEKKVVKGIRLLGDRLGTSDCTGNLPFIKNQTKTKQV